MSHRSITLRIICARAQVARAPLHLAGDADAGPGHGFVLRPTNYTAARPGAGRCPQRPGLGAPHPGMVSPAYMATQIDIVQERPRRRARGEDAAARPGSPARCAVARSTDGKISLDRLLRRASCSAAWRSSRRARATSSTSPGPAQPAEAARVANAFAQAYMDERSGDAHRAGHASTRTGSMDADQRLPRTQLEAAQSKLSEFQQETGIVVTTSAWTRRRRA